MNPEDEDFDPTNLLSALIGMMTGDKEMEQMARVYIEAKKQLHDKVQEFNEDPDKVRDYILDENTDPLLIVAAHTSALNALKELSTNLTVLASNISFLFGGEYARGMFNVIVEQVKDADQKLSDFKSEHDEVVEERMSNPIPWEEYKAQHTKTVDVSDLLLQQVFGGVANYGPDTQSA